MITGTAGRANVPVFDVSEQMPEEFDDPTDWIASLVQTISGLLPPMPRPMPMTPMKPIARRRCRRGGNRFRRRQDTAGDTSAPSNEGQQDPGR